MTVTQKPLKLGCSYGVRFSPDGTRLAVLGRDLVLWDVASRTRLWRGKFIAHCSSMAFSPDGGRLAIKSTTGQLAVVDAEAGQLLVNFQNKKDGEGCAPAWSPCGQYLAYGSWHGRLRVRDAQSVMSAVFSGPCLPERCQSRCGAPRGKRWRYGRAASTARANDGRASRRAR